MAEISPLRSRMIEDMTVRNLSPATQRSYINAVQKFSRHFGRSPDRLDLEDVRAFQVYLVSGGISWAARGCHIKLSSLRTGQRSRLSGEAGCNFPCIESL
ncbi:phage integrase N-terminal SAM-like domain-containing protein, partial [Rhizobium brockwellii]|uniref:phage integrase N-terminal SAM-like domain-containing protein n=1 Tax=Rhizobium brockwellii TaxID=3019932 RepID=UPI003F9C1814